MASHFPLLFRNVEKQIARDSIIYIHTDLEMAILFNIPNFVIFHFDQILVCLKCDMWSVHFHTFIKSIR